jgi:hypothetical protein
LILFEDKISVLPLISGVSFMPNPSPLPTISHMLQIILDSARRLENPRLVTLLERTNKEIDRLSREEMPESRRQEGADLPLESPSQRGEATGADRSETEQS